MDGVTVIGYQMNYPKLTDKLKNTNVKAYNGALYNAKVNEARKGMIATKINKANSKGTKITFDSCKSIEEFDKYCDELNNEFEKIKES